MNDTANVPQDTSQAGLQTEPNVTTAPPEPVVEQPKVPDTSWVPKRINEITAARRAAEERAARAEAELQALRAAQTAGTTPVATPPAGQHDIEALARSYAEKMVRDQTETTTINNRIAAINEAGVKEFGEDFQRSVDNLSAAGVGGPEFLRAIANIPSAEKLVTWLGKPENINDAARIVSLDPMQMGIEMMKLAPQAAKAFAKQISKAPPPAASIDGRGASDGTEPDPSNTEAWIAWRNKNRKTRR